MKNKYKLFLLLVILFFSLPTLAACPDMGKPKSDIRFKYGTLHYITNKSSKDFPDKPYSSTMGLTTANLSRKISPTFKIQPTEQNSYCVLLDTLTVEIGYKNIDIYIDKKYKPGTCNYKVIKEHENYHARVNQEGLKFFSPKIKKAYQIALNKIKPVEVYSNEESKQVTAQMMQQIEKEVQPLLDYVQKKIIEENLLIDTDSSYEAESKRCPKW